MTVPESASATQFEERYRAIASRDRRFDGQFYTAVRSTGIYCRPSCPARTPQRANVTFYRTSAAAQDAGYRACKRCLPEATPGTPEWDLRRDLAGRAMRLVRDGVVDRDGVPGLAAQLGYSPRHVHRTLVSELGVGPLSLARAKRAHTARTLIVQTDLPFAQIAFAAGFGSIRQFNDTVTEVFALTPGQLRERRAPRPPAALSATGSLELALPHREPYDAPGMIAFLAERAVLGVELVDCAALRYARTLRLPGGPAAFQATAATGQFIVQVHLSTLNDLPLAIARIRHLLDLDADPQAIDAVLSRDPALAPSVHAIAGIRLPGAVHGDEIVTRALIGQQISVAAARTHLGRLTAALGEPTTPVFGVTRLFPTSAQLADGAARVIRGPARRTATLTATMALLRDGQLTVSRGSDPDALRAQLLAVPGIGPWTAGYIAMRVLHDPDTLLAHDGALLTGARSWGLDGPGTTIAARAAALERRGAQWAPWRSYASMHLWRAASTLKGPR